MHRLASRHPLALAIGGVLTSMVLSAPVYAQQLIVEDGSTQTATGTYDGDVSNALRARNVGSTITGTGVTATSRGPVQAPANSVVLADLQGRVVLTDSFLTPTQFNTFGASATNGGRMELNNVAITMDANGGSGVHAGSAGQTTMQGGSILLTSTGAAAFAQGAGSSIALKNVDIDGDGGQGALANGGATVTVEGGTIDLDSGTVAQVNGTGSRVEIVGTKMTLSDTGRGAVFAEAGGFARLGPGTTLDMLDSNAALRAQGVGSVIEIDGARVTSQSGSGSVEAALASSGAQIRLSGGTVLQGLNAGDFGPEMVRAFGTGSLITSTDTTIIGADGVFAEGGGELRLGPNTLIQARGTGVQTIGAGSLASLDGAKVEVAGGNPTIAIGAIAFNDTRLNINNSSISSNGTGLAVGSVVTNLDGVIPPRGVANLENSTVRAALGVVAFQGASLTARNSKIESTGIGVQVVGTLLPTETTLIDLAGGSVTATAAPAIGIAGDTLLKLSQGVKLSGVGGVIIQAEDSVVDVQVSDNTNLEGVIDGFGTARTLSFANNSSLTGSVLGDLVTTDPLDGWRVSLDNTSAWTLTGDSLLASLTSAGRVAFATPTADAFKTLTVKGDYVGNGGTLVFNTRLGDSASLTDKLIVGGNTSGTTNVEIVNAGGGGAATTADGIEVIDVTGLSDGVFTQSGRVVAGAYDYFLKKGGTVDPADGDWYLRSELTPPVTPPPTTPPPTTPPPTTPPPTTPPPTTPPPTTPPTTPPPTEPGDAILRPEVGAYLGNQSVATTMFNYSLQDRIGSTAAARDGERGGGAWVRLSRSTVGGEVDPGQIDLDTDVTRLMFGVQVAALDLGAGTLELGVIGAQGHSTSQTQSDVTGYQAKGSVQGYSVGGYATWVSGGDGPGAYVDTWLQRGSYKMKVLGDGIGEERYDADTTTGSVEAGYAFAVGDALRVEPQLQAIYTDYTSDDHREANGTQVRDTDVDGVTTRLGVRVYGVSDATVKPYAALNWWHGPDDTEVAFDNTGIKLDLPRDRYEFRVGAMVRLGEQWSGWTDVSLQRAADDYSDARLQLGVNYSW